MQPKKSPPEPPPARPCGGSRERQPPGKTLVCNLNITVTSMVHHMVPHWVYHIWYTIWYARKASLFDLWNKRKMCFALQRETMIVRPTERNEALTSSAPPSFYKEPY